MMQREPEKRPAPEAQPVRCGCNKLLLKNISAQGMIEIHCPRCKRIIIIDLLPDKQPS